MPCRPAQKCLVENLSDFRGFNVTSRRPADGLRVLAVCFLLIERLASVQSV